MEKTFACLWTLLAITCGTILLCLQLGSCKSKPPAPANIFESGANTMLASDSSLLESLVEDVYEKVLIPLYYESYTTDDWTDNLYFAGPNPMVSEEVDTNYNRKFYQLDKLGLCDRTVEMIRKNAGISDRDKERWVTEILFLKGMVSYYLVQRFSHVNLDSLRVNPPGVADIRVSLADNYASILRCFQSCAALLPGNHNPERATSAAALAMITRIGLQAAADFPGEREKFLQLVVDAATAIFQQKEFAIDEDYKSLFNDFDKSLGSKEIIFGIYRRSATTSFEHTSMQHLTVNQSNQKMRAGYGPQLKDAFDGWAKRYPSQNLMDAYLVVEGGVAKKWKETSRARLFKPNQDLVSSVLYSNRDKRFYASIVYDSSGYFGNLIYTRDSGNFNMRARKDAGLLSPTGYYVRKTLYETKKVWYADGTNHHLPLLRMSEVYLNYAEALLLQGNKDLAISLINKTHTLHGGLPPLGKNLLPARVWEAYKNERRVELFLENDRYWSLLRWAKLENKKAVPELTEPIQGISIAANGKRYSIGKAEGVFNTTRKFTARRFQLPSAPGAQHSKTVF